jgi:hypothetical protein
VRATYHAIVDEGLIMRPAEHIARVPHRPAPRRFRVPLAG